jgi:dolichol-phosphate mannosyltransferase
MTGIKNAAYPLIITLDGDGQNDPANIDKLLRIYTGSETDDVMLAGYRYQRQDTGWRKLSSRIANAVRSRLLGDETPDTGCGLKVFSRELFLGLPYFDHMHRFLPALVKRAGGKVISVEVNHRPRKAGSSHYGTLDRLAVGIIDIIGVIWLMKRAKIPTIAKSEPATNSDPKI